jgi:ribosomal protein L22
MAATAESSEVQAPTVRAKARFVRTAPRKARLVADQVRGMDVTEAQTLLAFSSRGAARPISKLIASAAANAENNHDLVADDLRIAELRVDEGPIIKRWRARARGRATRIEKKTCHMSVVLTPIDE